MKLSEAILLGSIETKQAFGRLEHNGKTCAMGAAYVAEGIEFTQLHNTGYLSPISVPLIWKWAFIRSAIRRCPECNLPISLLLVPLIIHLNDDHKLSRPQIAAWVAKQEQLLLPVQVAVPVEESLLAPTSCQ